MIIFSTKVQLRKMIGDLKNNKESADTTSLQDDILNTPIEIHDQNDSYERSTNETLDKNDIIQICSELVDGIFVTLEVNPENKKTYHDLPTGKVIDHLIAETKNSIRDFIQSRSSEQQYRLKNCHAKEVLHFLKKISDGSQDRTINGILFYRFITKHYQETDNFNGLIKLAERYLSKGKNSNENIDKERIREYIYDIHKKIIKLHATISSLGDVASYVHAHNETSLLISYYKKIKVDMKGFWVEERNLRLLKKQARRTICSLRDIICDKKLKEANKNIPYILATMVAETVYGMAKRIEKDETIHILGDTEINKEYFFELLNDDKDSPVSIELDEPLIRIDTFSHLNSDIDTLLPALHIIHTKADSFYSTRINNIKEISECITSALTSYIELKNDMNETLTDKEISLVIEANRLMIQQGYHELAEIVLNSIKYFDTPAAQTSLRLITLFDAAKVDVIGSTHDYFVAVEKEIRNSELSDVDKEHLKEYINALSLEGVQNPLYFRKCKERILKAIDS